MHQFKKALGQNFLRHDRFAQKLIEPLQIQPEDVVVEIGPGDGRVTNLLLQAGARVLAIEKDYSLIPKLIAKFNSQPGFELVNEDVLDLDIVAEVEVKFPGTAVIKMVGSLPFNISKKIISNALNMSPPPEVMSFIVQAEVAKNYVTVAPKATFISNWAGLRADIKKLVSIPASQFFPVPKVDGAILVFKPSPENLELERIDKLQRIGFKSPRKTLWNNLSSTFNSNREELSTVWENLGLDQKVRPAELEPQQWLDLAAALSKAKIL
jgi:16S rRNA (adenine1518-N6/adenine1519-N6)-dimethyltransferase